MINGYQWGIVCHGCLSEGTLFQIRSMWRIPKPSPIAHRTITRRRRNRRNNAHKSDSHSSRVINVIRFFCRDSQSHKCFCRPEHCTDRFSTTAYWKTNKSWEPPASVASKFRKWTAPQPTSHISSAWHESLITWSSYIFLTFWWFPRLFVNHQCHQQLPHIPNSTTKFAFFVTDITDTLICAKHFFSHFLISLMYPCVISLMYPCVCWVYVPICSYTDVSVIPHSTTPSPRRGPGDPMGLQGFFGLLMLGRI